MWDDEDDFMSWETLEPGVVTQADCLGPEPWYMPVPWDSGFSEWGPQLEKAEGFDKWYLKVVQVLEEYDLEDLIDANIPRPAKKHDQAEDWLQMSQRVKKWLAAGISKELNRDIAVLGERIVLADEFMRQVKRVMQVESPYAHLRRIKAYEAIKLSHYPSTRKYISVVKAKFIDMYEMSPIFSPYYALMRILAQINEAQVVSDAMRTLAMRNHDSLVDKFTTEDFLHYCDLMIDQLRGLEGSESKAWSEKGY